ncbi:hypothetical protein NDU88_009067 [Pleurodeles waltl]|uniref:Uncharacterized protein n=1 Tax=Pleurodeles waltl TaxID=8319 RepID=A0AAV7RU75_PLEWA|nr:hypothetical protein NDU88_009067 [Pleurodeles waltl]
MEPNKVVQALKVLQDEGREDLLREGVLEQAWVGLKRPKRVSAEGVSAAVAACTSPVKSGKKFKSKSVGGRKVSRSPYRDEEPIQGVSVVKVSGAGKRRGGGRFSRRQGASLARRVAAGGRDSIVAGAVSVADRMGVQAVIAHARVASGCKQAPPPLEKGGGRVAVPLEERTLGGALKMAASSGSDWSRRGLLEERSLGVASKMAAPINIDNEDIVVISDDEEIEPVGQEKSGAQVFGGSSFVISRGAGRKLQLVPRLVSPMLHKVQSWQRDNEAVFGLGEQVDLIDGNGIFLRSKVCGESIVDRSVGRAFVSMDVSQPVEGEGTSWCGTPHASGGHGAKAVYQPSGRMVGDQSMPVKVRAPSEHRTEERVRSGAVRLTSGDATRASEVQPSTSQGAGVGWADWEELLDYDEDLEEPVVSTKRVMVAGEVPGVVQGSHVPVQSPGNLPRDEESVVEFLRAQRGWDNVGAVGRARARKGMVVGELRSKVDASIQVVSRVRTKFAPNGLLDTLLFAGQKSKLHHVILGDSWGLMVQG